MSRGAAPARYARSPRLRSVLLVLLLAGCAPERPARPPSILLYVVDTLRADFVGAYGNELVETPTMDRLAAEGLLFERAFAPASWTRPSMATLLTGVDPAEHGTTGRASVLPDEARTLAEVAREAGYATAFVVANPNAGKVFGFDQGFDEMLELYRSQDPRFIDPRKATTKSDVVTERALAWLEGVRPPFLLVILSIDPHFPYSPPQERLDAEVAKQPIDRQSPKAEDLARAFQANYRAEIAHTDQSLGRLLDGLDERDWLEETIVVVTADHGEEFFEHGRFQHGKTLYDEVLRVPLIVRHGASQRIVPGTRSDATARLADVMPTVLDLAGLPAPAGLRGRSLLAEDAKAPELVFARLTLDGFDLEAVRAPPWKLIRDRANDSHSLYELRIDPGERWARDDEEAFARLTALLDAHRAALAEGDALTADEVTELPEDVRASLRALGYLE